MVSSCARKVPWVAILFYLHFFPVWVLSFVAPAAILWTRSRLLMVLYTLLVVWIYYPRDAPKIFQYLQLLYFFEIPRYYKESSFRILYPQQHPQLCKILCLFDDAVEWQQRPDGHKHKEIGLTPEAIVVLTAFKPTALKLTALKQKAAIDGRVVKTVASEYPCDIWMCAPHGFTSNGWGQLSMCPFFNDIMNCVSTALYYFGHLIIAYTSLLGNPHPVTSEAIDRTLGQRRAISIVPGGFEEATIMSHNIDRLYLLKRYGIFKKAVDHCAGLVPYFTFGENRAYYNLQGFWKIRQTLNHFSIPGVIPWGMFLWLPKTNMFHIIVGKRITPQDGESVLDLKTRYLEQLTELHDIYGKEYYKNTYNHLEIW
ncbi:putative diacylglycerol acyltransferase [Gregarina niphandrodes]|uniref:Acyltransferase n=1 Tax=Gregarina niphandrodes TaxID=110365 RepID=A0A023B9A8_GRENI|nr:putative diacylglycerol acyltransferase [Gregarina niphandrodes]EZG72215.1 putative diacylglycerol acyltransferase [Gregarina niphandrodes]|eukprot:XP_011129791.1 putative diacylglycerol acyltransferase [Gregarina niphandrodes]